MALSGRPALRRRDEVFRAMISFTEDALIFLTSVRRRLVSLLPAQATQAFKTGRVTPVSPPAQRQEHI
ncbi:hypothetical protein SCP_0705810 [Sparassis crispa]|uniref:Uncharacterized protein n=1 Tax=Sparassis crispa TaxID=139825 RepID=A0A401GUI7_9APHY|nr:hypothetical protein SCP_0705810 [Sparassis crispa]GBE85394.1 hypothetical protein SCP_0705810 [Sparassis crispa]